MTSPNPATVDTRMPHHTDVRRRRRWTWSASCSCGWHEEAVSGFAAWSATRRHVYEYQEAVGMTRPTTSGHPRVRLIHDGPLAHLPYDQDSVR